MCFPCMVSGQRRVQRHGRFHATQLLRNRSTRSLWDPDYVDAQGLYDPVSNTSTARVMLIPRMKNWVATYYPGLQTAITEYNWGAENNINGATAQADVLGIFGREGLDYATRYTTPDPDTPTYKAMKMYRNYDGKEIHFRRYQHFGHRCPIRMSFRSLPHPGASDGAVTVMVINKQASAATPITLALSNVSPGGPAQVWQLTSANAIARLADISFSGVSLNLTVPAQSITLLVVARQRRIQRWQRERRGIRLVTAAVAGALRAAEENTWRRRRSWRPARFS